MYYYLKITSIFILFLTFTVHCVAQDNLPEIVSALPGKPPSDAVVLFDGSDLSMWSHADGSPSQWIIRDGVATVNGGNLLTKEHYGDMQLHLEFMIPVLFGEAKKGRGNSGIYIQNNYEIQIIDSYNNFEYAEGMCASVYRQTMPLANACRPPGIWQEYDIIFRAPRFGADGKKEKNAVVSVWQNGVLVQDHTEITGPTGAAGGNPEVPKGPIHLQDHGNPVKYRNIWVRSLAK